MSSIEFDERYLTFEDEMEELAADRLAMLDALGLTEHEWAWRHGGRKFEPFERPSKWLGEPVLPSLVQEVSAEVPTGEPVAVPIEEPVAALVEIPSIPPLPPGVPPLPTALVHVECVEGTVEIPPLPPPPPTPEIVLTDEQCAAREAIDEWYRGSDPFYALTGPAGSGKSTLMQAVIEDHWATLTAMTGKAALRLGQIVGKPASTLHKVLYYPPKPGEELRFTRLREPPSRLVVIDEASMMTPVVYGDLRKWAEWGTRILFVGDVYQLPPVITGKELQQYGEDYSVFTRVPGAHLETVMRNAGGVLRAATRVRETGDICRESYLDGNGGGYEFVRSSRAMEEAVNLYCADRHDHLLITWRNAIRMAASRMVRARIGHDGPLPDEGEPVLIKKNGQGFLNGEIVTCGGFDSGPQVGSLRTLWMKVKQAGFDSRILVSIDGGDKNKGGEFFDGHTPWIEDWKRYHIDLNEKCLPEPLPITWGYCVTAHSAQGSQAERTTVFLERGDDRSSHFRKATTLPSGETASFGARFIYTATTRSRSRTTMIVGR